jgi:FkbM family methyltransferase
MNSRLRIKLIQLLLAWNERIIFYRRLIGFYRKIPLQSPVIVDVGANKGQSIDFYLKVYPDAEIYSFEPNPELFQSLKKKYGLSNQVHLFNLGVSNISGRLILNMAVLDETSTFEALNFESSYLHRKAKILGVSNAKIIESRIEVDVITLNEFFQQNHLKQVNILKIDTEGHEVNVLKGLFISNQIPVDFIQLENHNHDMYLKNRPEELRELLESNGYQLEAEIKHGFGNFYEWIYRVKKNGSQV